MTPEQTKQIEEINLHIREALRQWSDVCLTADADEWAVHLRYFPADLMNATLIFQHVASSIGIHAGRIDEHTATDFGNRLRQLIQDMTGYDPHEFWQTQQPHEQEPTTDSTD